MCINVQIAHGTTKPLAGRQLLFVRVAIKGSSEDEVSAPELGPSAYTKEVLTSFDVRLLSDGVPANLDFPVLVGTKWLDQALCELKLEARVDFRRVVKGGCKRACFRGRCERAKAAEADFFLGASSQGW